MWEGTEWLEADGLGGFASGTVAGRRTRRYHALLLHAAPPPAGRMVLMNGFDAWVTTPSGSFAISSQEYAPGVIHPDGEGRIASFEAEPWPRWMYRLEDGTLIEQEIFVPRGLSVVALRWRLPAAREGAIALRPFLSGRDYHSLHHENAALSFDAETAPGRVVWRPYGGVAGIVALTNGNYVHEPVWYRNFLYKEESARGLDSTEDLASPGTLRWDLARGDAVLILTVEGKHTSLPGAGVSIAAAPAAHCFASLRSAEAFRRKRFPSRLHRAADAYIVERGARKTIVAGYPWFTDWGRDTFIALRGLCLATGRLDDARDILLAWAGAVDAGMLPNRFPDQGDVPEFNSVDASLWYIVAVNDFFGAMEKAAQELASGDREILQQAVEAILAGYSRGTRFGIRRDADGLLAAGQPGVQLTWMDAKVGDLVVTPRIGKPVEVEALWLNSLWVASRFSENWRAVYEQGLTSFRQRFWNDAGGCLHDVVDVDHRPGEVDSAFRPNQIFAAGGLPVSLLDGEKARRVVDAVEARLWTPLGLRSLDPADAGYVPRYEGGVRERDGAYHQGTVWPWLIGPFVEAWVRVRGSTDEAKREARARFVEPLIRHLDEAGLGHVSEIADGDPPHTPRGCPFQAWSVGEVLRLEYSVLALNSTTP